MKGRLLPQAMALSLAAGFALSAPAPSIALVSPPVHAEPLAPTGFVVDNAGVLDAPTRRRLTDALDRLQQRTGHQMVVITVASLGGADVTAFTTALHNRWGIGRRGLNDGIVVLVAPHDRRARISVGDGLLAPLPNAFCQQVMDRAMVPRFVRGQFGAGLEAGVGALIAALDRAHVAGHG